MSEIERIGQRIRNREALIEYHEDAVAGLKLRNAADRQRLDALGESEFERTIKTVNRVAPKIGDSITVSEAIRTGLITTRHLYFEGVEINEILGPIDDNGNIILRRGSVMTRVHETASFSVGLARLHFKYRVKHIASVDGSGCNSIGECLGCGAKPGEYHREGCDWEKCPVCFEKLIACGGNH